MHLSDKTVRSVILPLSLVVVRLSLMSQTENLHKAALSRKLYDVPSNLVIPRNAAKALANVFLHFYTTTWNSDLHHALMVKPSNKPKAKAIEEHLGKDCERYKSGKRMGQGVLLSCYHDVGKPFLFCAQI